jgi:hypothetical protein
MRAETRLSSLEWGMAAKEPVGKDIVWEASNVEGEKKMGFD